MSWLHRDILLVGIVSRKKEEVKTGAAFMVAPVLLNAKKSLQHSAHNYI